MKKILLIISLLFSTYLVQAYTGAVIKVRDMEHRDIIVTLNGRKYQKHGYVLTIQDVPPGINKIKVYRYRNAGYGFAKADLIYNGIVKIEPNHIYRCTIDDYEKMTVQNFCCVANNGYYTADPSWNNNGYSYNDNDFDWVDENWNNTNGNWNNGHWNNGNNNNGNWGNGNNGNWNNGNNNNGNWGNGNNGNWNNGNNNGNWGNNNGYMPMNPNAFNAFKQTVQNSSFDNSRLTLVKTQLNNNYITAQQLKELVQLFSFESGKLEAAMYGANRVIDNQNMFTIYDAFDFESSKTSFANHITSLGNNGGMWNNNNTNNGNWGNGNNGNGNWGNGNNGNGNWGNNNNGINYMNPNTFNSFKQSLQNSSFDNNRLQLMKSQLSTMFITAQQLKELVSLFQFESSKVDAAKYGATRVGDKQNLFVVYDAFEYENSKTQFAKYIETIK
jgi:hypothetical protein